MSAKPSKLADQQEALDAFFESLLNDVEAYAEQEEGSLAHQDNSLEPVNLAAVETKPETKPIPEPLVSLTRPVAVVDEETPSIFETLPAVAPSAPKVDAAQALDQPVEAQEEIQQPPVEDVDGVPDAVDPPWLGQELQAMLFKVAGLTLAVPLVDLNGVVEWDEEKLTTMPGHADFYLGLMSHLGKQIPVVDTAQLVLPAKKRQELGDDPQQRVTRVVLINGSQYGLACDEVNEVVTLKADAVRWRSERTQRRWLAGTVIEHMCALVDATAFAELLAKRTPVDAFRT